MTKLLGLFFIFSLAFASTVKITPAILAAREKVLQKDRLAAIKILQEAEKAEKNVKRKAELRGEAKRVAQLFFTNEGQRSYELAESIRYSGQQGYLPKYEEAFNKEGPHLGVYLGLASGHMQAKNCAKAVEFAQQALDFDPDNTEGQVLLWRARICLAPNQVSKLNLTSAESTPAIQAMREALSAGAAIQNQELNTAENLARKAISFDPQYPGGYYWLWQVKLKNEDDSAPESAEKYVTQCKEVTPELRRKYYLDSDLCFDIVSAQEYLKKIESRQ